MKSTKKTSSITIYSFKAYAFFLIADTLLFVIDNSNIFEIPSSVYQVVNFSQLIIFIINVITFLTWYNNITSNYSTIVKKTDSKNNYLIFWFIPLINIIHPYFSFRKIISTYENPNKKRKSIFISLNIWAASFLIWYIIIIYINLTIPMFHEDVEIFYDFNPIRDWGDLLFPNFTEIIGLFSMIVFIRKITQLEYNFFNSNDKIDIIEHLTN